MKYVVTMVFALAGTICSSDSIHAQNTSDVFLASPRRINQTTTPEQSNEKVVTEAKAPAAPAEQIKREEDPLRLQVQEAIDYSRRRYLDGNLHTPWQIVHGLLALRQDYEIKVNGEKTNALKWVQEGQRYNGQPWVEKTRHGGRFHRYTQPYHFEGHPNQFLAILTMLDLPRELEFQGAGGKVTIADMVENAKATVNDDEEITWTLWALAKYLEVDASWRNQYGEYWDMERLVRLQTQADPNDAACGGTHGLFALARARNAYVETGKPMKGAWLEADQKLRRYINMAKSMQYSDGTFSCNYFISQNYKRDFAERLSPTGHTLEFLMLAIPDEQLNEAWIRKGVDAVSKDLVTNRSIPVDCGPLYHALSGLVIYLERTAPTEPEVEIADSNPVLNVTPVKETRLDEAPKLDVVPLVAPKPQLELKTLETQNAGD